MAGACTWGFLVNVLDSGVADVALSAREALNVKSGGHAKTYATYNCATRPAAQGPIASP
jgi:hypothetical protein